jgi:hypothetical protein
MKSEERYDKYTEFLKTYEEYMMDYDVRWEKTFNETIQFINENQKRPSKSSKNQEEKKLGRWLCTQNKNYKNKTDGMKSEERYDKYTDFLKTYEEYF